MVKYETINPIEDAYINAQYPDTNYGSASSLVLGYWNYRKNIYLKFTIPSHFSSTLELYEYDYNYTDSSLSFKIQQCSNNWNETSITWNNTPSPFGSTLSVSWSTVSGWHQVDITSLISTLPSGSTVSLVLISPTSGPTDDLLFYSREAENYHPRLILEVRRNVEKRISSSYLVPATNPPSVTFFEINGSGAIQTPISSAKYYVKDTCNPSSTLNPIPVPYPYNQGFNGTDYHYSYWKHFFASITASEGTIVEVSVYPEDASQWKNKLIVVLRDSGDNGCPIGSYQVANGTEVTGFPINSNLPGSLGHAYYRDQTTGVGTIDSYSNTCPLIIDTSTGIVLTSKCLVSQLKIPVMAVSRSYWGTGPKDVLKRSLGEKVLIWTIKESRSDGTFPFHFKLTLNAEICSLTIPVLPIKASISMFGISGEISSGTLRAWDDENCSTALDEIFTGTSYFGDNSMLRACVTAENVSFSSTLGSFPPGWEEDAPSSLQFQLRGTQRVITFGSIDEGNMTRFAIRLMTPYDMKKRGEVKAYLEIVGEESGEHTIYWNVGSDSSPVWVPSNSFFFASSLTGYRRVSWEYPTEGRIYVPLASFSSTLNKVFIIYDRDAPEVT